MGSQTNSPALLRPRLFLDANVLFSACVTPTGRAAALIRLAQAHLCELLSSPHAVEETRRNLMIRYPGSEARLASVLRVVSLVPEAPVGLVRWARDLELPDQDAPILAAAVHAGADALVTGDRTHFGRLFGRAVQGVRVVPLSDALRVLGFGA